MTHRTGMRPLTVAETRAIATVARLLSEGAIGYEGLYSDVQSNYRDAWIELYRRVDKAGQVARWMTELMDHAPPAPPPSAVNTTHYARG